MIHEKAAETFEIRADHAYGPDERLDKVLVGLWVVSPLPRQVRTSSAERL
jgi:hypothetical protein